MIYHRFHPSLIAFLAVFAALVCGPASAALPQTLNHQGRIAVQGVNFDGNGQFKFAFVNADGTATYWSNDGTSVAGAEPTAAVTLPVNKGLYSVLLGDAALPNMTAIPPSALEHEDVRLRVWFNDGVKGFQQITPDQRLAAVPYSIHARKALATETFSGLLAGDVTGGQSATAIADAIVTGKRLTGFASSSGTVSSSDSLLTAIGKLHGNTALKANLASPTFTGTVSGITAQMVGLGAVNNTSDNDKPVSFWQQRELNFKANLDSPAFTGNVTGITKFSVGLSEVDNTSDWDKPISRLQDRNNREQQNALEEKAPLVNPRFDGWVYGITPEMIGLGNVDNTPDEYKPISYYQQAAFEAQQAVSDEQQRALEEKAPLNSPFFTGTVRGITSDMVGLGNVDNTPDEYKPMSYFQRMFYESLQVNIVAQQEALEEKAPLDSPHFTGTVNGIDSSMVGLGNVSNTSDANKPVSTAQQTALNLKANLASPGFTGTVVLPGGSTTAAPLRFASGGTLAAPVFGAVEFDGANLYLTTNAASPVRKTLAFTEDGISEVSLSSITAPPVKPVVAWGDNNSGQTTPPALANVAAVAAGEAHSLALLDDGTLVAWGLNGSGQTTIPAGLAGVTQISAGANFNLVRKNNGTVAAWGANDYGQTTLPAGITTATQVAAGEKHGLALLANGTVLAWGDNTFGQTTVPTLSNVIAIAAGYDHSLALKSDGKVVAWGRNDAGQVEQNYLVPYTLSGITAIAAGAYHSLALKSDGKVVAWGWDGGGQVTLPAGLTDVMKIAGGYGFSMALKADGSVVVWGDNSATQTTVPSSATRVTHIAAGASHALALRADSIPAQVARLDQDNVFSGKVGIGRTPAVNALEVAGNASKSTAGSWLSNSDRRIKTGIESIEGALEKLDQVRLVDFRYTDAYLAVHPEIKDRRYPNVIAQEFAEVFPDDVKSSGERLPDGSEVLQVDTYPLTIYTAAAVQELHRENQALKQQVAAQELRLRKLEAALGE